MTNPKCLRCGLVNFAQAEECKRCGAALHAILNAVETGDEPTPFAEDAVADEPEMRAPRSLFKRVGVGVGVAACLLFLFYISLLETSTPATYDEKKIVQRSIEIIEESGFARDAFLLRRLTSFRTTDHWWNRWLGHGDAYAATNFPFQIITLYPEFFTVARDDTERAVILLHEARHLAGAGEETAFASVWRDKARLGWTKERYGRTRVWRNVNEFTYKYAPHVLLCGAGERPDCP